MSSICQNCRTKLSCGCQKRTASNGTSVCSTCLNSYELSINKLYKATPNPSTKDTAPSNVHVFQNRHNT